MASFFLPLQRTTTAAICSSSSLIVTSFKQHLAPHPCSTPPLRLLRLYRVPHFNSHYLIFMPEFDFWPGIALPPLAHLTKSAAPSQGCSTNSPTRQQTHYSSSDSYLHSWCMPHNLRFVTKSPVWRLSSRILQAFSYSSDHPKTLKIFIAEMEF